VNGHTQFLHDGRARNLLEAILWHGGEAEAAKQQVLTYDAEQRSTLLAFLNSL
ncbi:MAG: di-heme oxidoredictase family protein, partial [Pseudomonas sp.]